MTNFLVIGLGIAVFSFAAVTVFSYSHLAGLKHEISSLAKEIDRAKSENADLKNNLFKMTDPQSLETVAEEYGLIEDKNPKWVFASL